jgi:ATP:ADP antiporter, AAA family
MRYTLFSCILTIMSILPPKRTSASTGLNILDLGNSSREQVVLVKIILKKINATYLELWEATQSLPGKQTIDRAAFDLALQELVESKWLWKTGSGELAVYSPRLQKKVSRARMRFEMRADANPAAAFSAMWNLLEQRAALEQDAVTAAQPTRPAAASRLTNWISTLAGVRQIMLLLVFISAASAFSASTLEIVGVSGFVGTVGTKNLPWLSIAEMLLGLLTSAVYIQFADRFPRVRLMKWILAGLTGTYLVMTVLFLASTSLPFLASLARGLGLKAPQALLYPLLYLLRSQQITLFPIAFWNLANHLYSMTEARKVFPILASGGTVGGLIGYALFTDLFGGRAIFTSADAPLLLGLNVAFFALSLILTQGILKEKLDDDIDEVEKAPNMLENIRAGLLTIHEIPLFRYLALVVMLVRVTFCIFIYHFVNSLNEAGGNFSSLYSLFGIASAVLPLILQWRVTTLFSGKVDTRNTFIILPVTLALSIGLTSLFPGALPVSLGLLASGSVSSSWDYPMFNTLQNLIPEERRAQISTLLNNYSFAVGQITGSSILLVVFALAPRLNLSQEMLYLPVGILTAIGAVLAAIAVSHTYTNSMLSWRVARRQRSSSVLDKLNF